MHDKCTLLLLLLQKYPLLCAILLPQYMPTLKGWTNRHGDCSIPTHSIVSKQNHYSECHACLTFNIHSIVLLEVTLTTLINSDFADITFHAVALETD